MKFLLVLIHTFSFTLASNDGLPKMYKNVFPNLVKLSAAEIDDPITPDAPNSQIQKVFSSQKLIGFIREISTTTGCNDGCLPVIFTLYFDSLGNFIKLHSKPGLTKRYHEPYKPEDYIKLEGIILRNPISFKKVLHPKMMVDAISSATLKEYKSDVIAKSAYTTLRVNLYFHQTQKFIKKKLLKSK